MKETAFLTTDQILLVKAALWPVDEALHYWQQWKAYQCIDEPLLLRENDLLPKVFDPLDYETQAFMSQVYHNLQHTGDALVSRFRGYYRHTWLKSELTWLSFQRVVKAFAEQGIESVCLQGSAARLACAGHSYGRRLQDAAFSVPVRWHAAVPSIMQNLGFQSGASHTHSSASRSFTDSRNTTIVFQPKLLPSLSAAKTEHPFRNQVKQLHLAEGVNACILTPTYQIFCDLVWAYYRQCGPDLRRIADCVLLARYQPVDWEKVMQLADDLGYSYAVMSGLGHLVKHFDIQLTEAEAVRLKKSRIAKSQQRYHALLQEYGTSPLNSKQVLKKAILEYTAYSKNDRCVSGMRLLKHIVSAGIKRLC